MTFTTSDLCLSFFRKQPDTYTVGHLLVNCKIIFLSIGCWHTQVSCLQGHHNTMLSASICLASSDVFTKLLPRSKVLGIPFNDGILFIQMLAI